MILTEKNPEGLQAGRGSEKVLTGDEDTKPKPKHQTAKTSISSFTKYRKARTAESLTLRICEAIRTYGPLSRRQLSEKLGAEIGSLCYPLNAMERTADPIAFVVIKPCPITGQRVKIYDLYECVSGKQIELPL